MGLGRMSATDTAWAVLEELYLESADDQRRAAYREMTPRERWGALEPFLRSRMKSNPSDRWIGLLAERLAAKAERD